MAKIVVFEGPDKVGKETQSKLLDEALYAAGYSSLRLEVPTKLCPNTYKMIYWMLKNGWAKRLPNVFQFVQFLNKWFFQKTILPILMKTRDVLIFDRWSLSAVIYGEATGVNRWLNTWFYNRLVKADVTVVMCEKSFRRSTTEDDDYEKDTELQRAVKDGYREWAVLHAADHILVKNDRPVKDIHEGILIDLTMFGIP